VSGLIVDRTSGLRAVSLNMPLLTSKLNLCGMVDLHSRASWAYRACFRDVGSVSELPRGDTVRAAKVYCMTFAEETSNSDSPPSAMRAALRWDCR
jgi:hypothetical protein